MVKVGAVARSVNRAPYGRENLAFACGQRYEQIEQGDVPPPNYSRPSFYVIGAPTAAV
jgi:hypothetical protein